MQKSAIQFSDGSESKDNRRNTKVYKFNLYSFQACTVRAAAGFSNPGGLAVTWWA